MHERSIESYDGTRIVYQIGGKGDRWLVVANGYGGTFSAWQPIFADLEQHYRILLWDYRGLFRSGTPANPANLTIEDNCRDLERLMAAEGIRTMVLAGWSVGVQVVLEHYRRQPQTVEALMLINGSHGRVLHRSLDGRLAALVMPRLIPPAARLAPRIEPVVLPVLQRLTRPRAALCAASSLGVVHGMPEAFHSALNEVLTLDFATYLSMVVLADQHDAEQVLPSVQVPTLVTAGDHDRITPPRIGRFQARQIPHAMYVEIPHGTHYAVMEFPRLFAVRMHDFIRNELELSGR